MRIIHIMMIMRLTKRLKSGLMKIKWMILKKLKMLYEEIKGKKDLKFGMSSKKLVFLLGKKKGECVHCKKQLLIGVTGATTQFKRHLDRCAARIRAIKKQKILHFQPSDIENSFSQSSQDGGMLTTFKYDHQKVREMIAHYILINEKPFSIVEEFGFNLILKSMSPFFVKYSRATARNDVIQVYEREKKKLKNALKVINKISFTTDLWK
ncbi:hypothetical protein KFK09_019931 [Dendrobium nobile]|uniref:BED-type domain-containing protein n=1 Tax=Dendrobium nobile TaxID=94219 RepID=A0A8T3ASE9_DENNO|nr:hypothetical protein KFK09_019931 [Dendrobium nobile]